MDRVFSETQESIALDRRTIETLADSVQVNTRECADDMIERMQIASDVGWYSYIADDANMFRAIAEAFTEPCVKLETAADELDDYLTELDYTLYDFIRVGTPEMFTEFNSELADMLAKPHIAQLCSIIRDDCVKTIYNVCGQALESVQEFDSKLCDMNRQGIGVYDDELDILFMHRWVLSYIRAIMLARDNCIELSRVTVNVNDTVAKLQQALASHSAGK